MLGVSGLGLLRVFGFEVKGLGLRGFGPCRELATITKPHNAKTPTDSAEQSQGDEDFVHLRLI